jgi:hypothetical protein
MFLHSDDRPQFCWHIVAIRAGLRWGEQVSAGSEPRGSNPPGSLRNLRKFAMCRGFSETTPGGFNPRRSPKLSY